MTQVKQEKTSFGGKPFVMRVRVDKCGKFRINLPKYATCSLGVTQVVADTMDAATNEFRKQQRIYSEMLTVGRKVIRFKFSANLKEFRHDGKRHDNGFQPGAGVMLSVANCFEFTHRDADGNELRRSYRWPSELGDEFDEEQPYPDAFLYSQFDCVVRDQTSTTVAWDRKTESFFVGLCGTLLAITEKLVALETPENLLAAASNSVRIALQPEDRCS